MQNRNQTTTAAADHKRSSGFQFSKVLVPVDFSKSSLASVRFAVKVARQHDSQLVLLQVIEPMEGVGSATRHESGCQIANRPGLP